MTISTFRNAKYVHVREYNVYGDRKYPSKKGIALDIRRFKSLLINMDRVREALAQVIMDQKVQEKFHWVMGFTQRSKRLIDAFRFGSTICWMERSYRD